MSQARYKFDVYNRGVNATTGGIAFTIQTSQLDLRRGAPSLGGYLVRPTQGTVESQPWTFHILDKNSTFTAQLADSSGRLQLIGRLVRARIALNSTASTAYKSMTVGRISDISLNPEVASYGVTVTDERWIERQLMVFTQLDDSLSFMPGGLVKNAPANAITAPINAQWTCRFTTGNLVLLQLTDQVGQTLYDAPISQFIYRDLKVPPAYPFPVASPGSLTVGSFKHLRWRNTASATDFEIAAIGAEIGTPPNMFKFPKNPLHGLHYYQGNGTQIDAGVWLVWTSSPPTVGQIVTGYVHASGATPDPSAPLFIGGTNGYHPGHLARLLYTGTFSTGSLTLRISTGAFDAWEADPSYGTLWLHSTGPQALSDVLEKRLFQPYGMVPAIDSSGKISPVSVLTPLSTQASASAAVTIGSSNIPGHPTWTNLGREAVNSLTMTYEAFGLDISSLLNNTGNTPAHFKSADKLAWTTMTFRSVYNTSTTLGRRELSLRYGAVALPIPVSYTTSPPPPPAGSFLARQANSIFQRFGDGPEYSDVTCLASVDNTTLGKVKVGQFVKVKLATFPNAAIRARGSTRLMQVVRRLDPLGTPTFTLLGLGVSTGPLATPTVSALALSSISSRHAIKATLSGLALKATYELRVAGTSTGAGSVPAGNSSKWRTAAVSTALGSTSATQQVFFLASEKKWWAEVRLTKPGRINSAWSTAKSVVTASIPNPTSEVLSSTAGGQAIVKWKPGSTLYRTDIHVQDSSASFTPGTTNFVQSAPPGTTRALLTGFVLGHKARVLLRHGDPYGGYDAGISAVLTPGSTSYSAAPAMKGITIVKGIV